MPIPVPAYPSGYRLGSGDAPVQIDVFVDLQCPFSKKAWPTMMALVNEDDRDRLAIAAQPMVLCDHRQSWDLTKTIAAIAQYDPLQGWKLISHFYQHQQAFASEAFQTQTRENLYDLIEDLIEKFDPSLPKGDIVETVKQDSGEVANRAKASIRYGIDRGVWSTPTFLVNDSEVPHLESSSTLQDWRSFLNSL